ncbi:P-loop containing nucleoside triphosphate hydrolase protein [Hysterangium stoloniferum]|nr:P-loop containing nucleoside triphosphate hydrolase protein [Hysterangium stoloniferum]
MEWAPWVGLLNWIAGLLGISVSFPSLVASPIVWDAVKLLFLGSVIETGRRMYRSIVGMFRFRYSVTGEFKSHDPTYQWLVSYLTKEKIWRTPYDFVVESRSSRRKWKLETEPSPGEHTETHVDYVPSYTITQFFRWKGYFLEVTQPYSAAPPMYTNDGYDAGPFTSNRIPHSLFLKIYTRRKSALFEFVEECRLRYMESSKPQITIHSQGANGMGPPGQFNWSNVQTKRRRPIDSLLLEGNAVKDLINDAREFMELEDWYIKAGIPHRRGYLLYGPPGTGKTSTVYTIAGELGLDIYFLSLSATGLDDTQLAAAVSSLPHRGILLIEDIDCAFPSRTDETEGASDSQPNPYGPMAWGGWNRTSQITLSGLLNVLDGIGSEEGKIFFATTNHIERLDPALLRPGRIDRKIPYKLATRAQCRALFNRFFPPTLFGSNNMRKAPTIGGHPILQSVPDEKLALLADTFADRLSEYEFSIAELQGYFLDHKLRPVDAAEEVEAWAAKERALRAEMAEKERVRKEKVKRAKVEEQLGVSEAVIAGIGNAMARYPPPIPMGGSMYPYSAPVLCPPAPLIRIPPPVSVTPPDFMTEQGSISPAGADPGPMGNHC